MVIGTTSVGAGKRERGGPSQLSKLEMTRHIREKTYQGLEVEGSWGRRASSGTSKSHEKKQWGDTKKRNQEKTKFRPTNMTAGGAEEVKGLAD